MVSEENPVKVVVDKPNNWSTGFISFCISLISLLPLLVRGPLDQEEYDLGIFSGRFAFKAFFDGSYGLWLPDLGFGTPMPVGQSFGSYLPFVMFDMLSMSQWFIVFWLLQLWLGIYCMLRLCRSLDIKRNVGLLAAVTFALSMPTVNYGFTDEWPTAFFTWTIYPVVILLLTNFLQAEDDKFAPKVGLLGFIMGVWLLKSHPGHLSILVIPMVIYVLVLMPWRNTRIWLGLSLACLISLLMSFDTYAFIAIESSRFPANLARATQSGYTPQTYLWTLLYPLTFPVEQTFVVSLKDFLRNRFSRGPFFGTPFMLIAVGAALWAILEQNRQRTAAGLAFLVSLTLSLADSSMVKVFSGMWLARDPLIIFGILSAAMALTAILNSRSVWCRRIGISLMVCQIMQLLLAFIPFIAYSGFHYDAPKTFTNRIHYLGEDASSNLKSWLTGNGSRIGQRFLLSTQVQSDMRRTWTSEGVYGYTALVRIGLPVVNGWFKNISMDTIYPSSYLMHGKISGNSAIFNNRSFLDVAGIKWILLDADELKDFPRYTDFEFPHIYKGKNGQSLALLENPRAWPLAVFIDHDIINLHKLPRAAGCSYEGISCANLDYLKAAKQPGNIDSHMSHERITLKFQPSSHTRQALLTVFAHDGWKAQTGGEKLPINKIDGAFMSVQVPAGASKIELSYQPTFRLTAMLISLISSTLAACYVLYCYSPQLLNQLKKSIKHAKWRKN